MRHAFLDKYSRLNSVLHRRDPRVKILVFFAFILCVVLTPPAHIRAFFLYFLLLLCLTVLSRIPGRFVLKRSLELMPVVLCISLFVPFGKPGVVIFSVDTWFNRLAVTHTGLLLLWNVLIKAYLSILCSILLTNTTDFVDLLKALERLRLPRILIMILSFMYRYLLLLRMNLKKCSLPEAPDLCASTDGARYGRLRIWQVFCFFVHTRRQRLYIWQCAAGVIQARYTPFITCS